MYISCTLNPWSRDLNADFTLGTCLFGSLELTKDTDPDKYKYSGYGIGFDSRSEFSLTDGSLGKSDIIFEVDMSISVHIDSKNKDEGPTKGLDDTTLRAETKYSITFILSRKKFVYSTKFTLSWKQQFLIS